jgi:cytochrome c peroxidase
LALAQPLLFLLATLAVVGSPAAEPYQWQLPPGFPVPAVPADNPMSAAKVALGQRLFLDKRWSVTGEYACASCHQPALAYTDGRALAVGATGGTLARSAMSLANVAYNMAFTWNDRRPRSLEAQMRTPLFNEHPIEMGLAGRETVIVSLLSADEAERQLFAEAFPGESQPVSITNLIKAIACFERTLISGRSAFDRYVFDDDRSAMTDSARRGMALFYSPRLGCAQCHSGISFAGPVAAAHSPRATPLYADTGTGGSFKVPSLRNVAVTAPYMHDGRMATLDAVIDHYAQGGTRRAAITRLRPFTLDQPERQQLIDFLGSLTDPEFLAAGVSAAH